MPFIAYAIFFSKVMTEGKVVIIVYLNLFKYKQKILEYGRQIKDGVKVRLKENKYVNALYHKESVTMR